MSDPRLDVESLRAIRQREAETVPLSTNPAELDRRRLLVYVDALDARIRDLEACVLEYRHARDWGEVGAADAVAKKLLTPAETEGKHG
jgi:hypothetical protein